MRRLRHQSSHSRRRSRRFLQKIRALGSFTVSVGFADARVSFCVLWKHSCALIAGCRGIIPLPGRFYRGSAPQGFDFAFPTPLRGHNTDHEQSPSHRPLEERRSSQGRSGVEGAAPPVAARMLRLGHQSSHSRRRSRRFLQKIRALGSFTVRVGFAAARVSFCAPWKPSSGNRGQAPFPPTPLRGSVGPRRP
jgi:hypothetical protein